jgi:hypothetical protein
MVSQIKVNEIIKQSGSSITIGETNDTITLPSTATLTNFPKNKNFFIARNSGDQNLSDNTWTKVTMGTADVDADSVWDTSNSRFTAPETGSYFFCYVVGLYGNSGAVGPNWATRFYKNGSALNRGTYNGLSLSSVNMTEKYSGAAVMLQLSANDYIELYANMNVTSGAPAIDQTTQMSGYRIIL